MPTSTLQVPDWVVEAYRKAFGDFLRHYPLAYGFNENLLMTAERVKDFRYVSMRERNNSIFSSHKGAPILERLEEVDKQHLTEHLASRRHLIPAQMYQRALTEQYALPKNWDRHEDVRMAINTYKEAYAAVLKIGIDVSVVWRCFLWPADKTRFEAAIERYNAQLAICLKAQAEFQKKLAAHFKTQHKIFIHWSEIKAVKTLPQLPPTCIRPDALEQQFVNVLGYRHPGRLFNDNPPRWGKSLEDRADSVWDQYWESTVGKLLGSYRQQFNALAARVRKGEIISENEIEALQQLASSTEKAFSQFAVDLWLYQLDKLTVKKSIYPELRQKLHALYQLKLQSQEALEWSPEFAQAFLPLALLLSDGLQDMLFQSSKIEKLAELAPVLLQLVRQMSARRLPGSILSPEAVIQALTHGQDLNAWLSAHPDVDEGLLRQKIQEYRAEYARLTMRVQFGQMVGAGQLDVLKNKAQGVLAVESQVAENLFEQLSISVKQTNLVTVLRAQGGNRTFPTDYVWKYDLRAELLAFKETLQGAEVVGWPPSFVTTLENYFQCFKETLSSNNPAAHKADLIQKHTAMKVFLDSYSAVPVGKTARQPLPQLWKEAYETNGSPQPGWLANKPAVSPLYWIEKIEAELGLSPQRLYPPALNKAFYELCGAFSKVAKIENLDAQQWQPIAEAGTNLENALQKCKDATIAQPAGWQLPEKGEIIFQFNTEEYDEAQQILRRSPRWLSAREKALIKTYQEFFRHIAPHNEITDQNELERQQRSTVTDLTRQGSAIGGLNITQFYPLTSAQTPGESLQPIDNVLEKIGMATPAIRKFLRCFFHQHSLTYAQFVCYSQKLGPHGARIGGDSDRGNIQVDADGNAIVTLKTRLSLNTLQGETRDKGKPFPVDGEAVTVLKIAAPANATEISQVTTSVCNSYVVSQTHRLTNYLLTVQAQQVLTKLINGETLLSSDQHIIALAENHPDNRSAQVLKAWHALCERHTGSSRLTAMMFSAARQPVIQPSLTKILEGEPAEPGRVQPEVIKSAYLLRALQAMANTAHVPGHKEALQAYVLAAGKNQEHKELIHAILKPRQKPFSRQSRAILAQLTPTTIAKLLLLNPKWLVQGSKKARRHFKQLFSHTLGQMLAADKLALLNMWQNLPTFAAGRRDVLALLIQQLREQNPAEFKAWFYQQINIEQKTVTPLLGQICQDNFNAVYAFVADSLTTAEQHDLLWLADGTATNAARNLHALFASLVRNTYSPESFARFVALYNHEVTAGRQGRTPVWNMVNANPDVWLNMILVQDSLPQNLDISYMEAKLKMVNAQRVVPTQAKFTQAWLQQPQTNSNAHLLLRLMRFAEKHPGARLAGFSKFFRRYDAKTVMAQLRAYKASINLQNSVQRSAFEDYVLQVARVHPTLVNQWFGTSAGRLHRLLSGSVFTRIRRVRSWLQANTLFTLHRHIRGVRELLVLLNQSRTLRGDELTVLQSRIKMKFLALKGAGLQRLLLLAKGDSELPLLANILSPRPVSSGARPTVFATLLPHILANEPDAMARLALIVQLKQKLGGGSEVGRQAFVNKLKQLSVVERMAFIQRHWTEEQVTVMAPWVGLDGEIATVKSFVQQVESLWQNAPAVIEQTQIQQVLAWLDEQIAIETIKNGSYYRQSAKLANDSHLPYLAKTGPIMVAALLQASAAAVFQYMCVAKEEARPHPELLQVFKQYIVEQIADKSLASQTKLHDLLALELASDGNMTPPPKLTPLTEVLYSNPDAWLTLINADLAKTEASQQFLMSAKFRDFVKGSEQAETLVSAFINLVNTNPLLQINPRFGTSLVYLLHPWSANPTSTMKTQLSKAFGESWATELWNISKMAGHESLALNINKIMSASPNRALAAEAQSKPLGLEVRQRQTAKTPEQITNLWKAAMQRHSPPSSPQDSPANSKVLGHSGIFPAVEGQLGQGNNSLLSNSTMIEVMG